MGGFEGGCWVRGAGDPFEVEAERDGEGDYCCEVESKNRDSKTESWATWTGGDLEV